MAKRAVRTTVKPDVDVMPETDVTGQPNGHPSENDVRVRAYQRYLERGGTHGNDVDDWVEAERELKRQS